MAENTFKSPGFFEREIELTAEKQQPTGVPAGIIGAAKMGPAFVPLTLGTFKDFENRFGSLTPEKFAPYAVSEWLKHRQSVTFMRVLGAGANSTSTDFATTRQYGSAKNAGFKAEDGGTVVVDKFIGATQFLTAKHIVSANSDIGFPIFTDNSTFGTAGLSDIIEKGETGVDADFTPGDAGDDPANSLRETTTPTADEIHICRAMILNASGSFFQLYKNSGGALAWDDNEGYIEAKDGSNEFKMRLTLGDGVAAEKATFGEDSTFSFNGEERPNKIFTVSLDPDNTNYIGKVLNTDPKKFQEEGHLLWLDFAIEHELAPVSAHYDENGDGVDDDGVDRNFNENNVFLSRGADNQDGMNDTFASAYTSTQWRDLFGWFNARYQAPKTTSFISQPFGNVEYDLFHFECLSDGAVANNEFKVSISNIKKSANPNYPYGTFNVQIRKFGDSDFAPEILEQFVECNLDPDSDQFVGKKVGDKKVVFDFDADLEDERRLVISGRYPNQSLNVRIVINDAVYKRQIPAGSLPFGFRGIPVLNIYNHLAHSQAKLAFLPPMPYVFKATKGKIKTSDFSFQGEAGDNERSDARVYWGVKTTRIADNALVTDAVLQPNISGLPSKIVEAYTKFQGIPGGSIKIGNLVDSQWGAASTDAGADLFNDNKFTLARVALSRRLDQLSYPAGTPSTSNPQPSFFDSLNSTSVEMKSACYIRNGVPNPSNYTIADNHDGTTYDDRVTFASLVHDHKPNNFNKFSKFAKFTNVFYGGWDGLNILDPDIEDLNDRAASSESGSSVATSGKAGLIAGGLGLRNTQTGASVAMSGEGKDNNVIASYRQAIKQMTDPMTVRTNLLCIPGIRDPYVTDFAADKVRDYSMAMYVMDIPNFNGDQQRIFDTGSRPDVEYTSNNLEGRGVDNNYVASYFPDVFITDQVNGRRVLVPASIAAIGALSYSDNVSYPWFAPAGFNRGSLDFVENVRTRLSVSDRDDLYDRKINPIANFPNGGFVIFGQKTMQQNQSALDRVNVRRLLLEVKRQVSEVANIVLFEQNTPATRERFVNLVQPRLALIQAQAGIEKFQVICDDTNNTPQDAEENRLNGKIVLIPTRTIEFIAIDFIVTNAGVSFE